MSSSSRSSSNSGRGGGFRDGRTGSGCGCGSHCDGGHGRRSHCNGGQVHLRGVHRRDGRGRHDGNVAFGLRRWVRAGVPVGVGRNVLRDRLPLFLLRLFRRRRRLLLVLFDFTIEVGDGAAVGAEKDWPFLGNEGTDALVVPNVRARSDEKGLAGLQEIKSAGRG